MFDERMFIARVEAADVDGLIDIVTHPSVDEEKALRVHLGDDRYQRMHSLALRRNIQRHVRGEVDQRKENVVVIPGIMGSELSAVTRSGSSEQVWLKILRIVGGRLGDLRLDDAGLVEHNPAYDVRATGILKRYYGELLLSLSLQYNVRAFWFDWRKDLNLAANELRAHIGGWFGDNAPVHIVAHSMGGLVARSFIKNHPERWATMQQGTVGGRLIMLGTPNHGSFTVPQLITGLDRLIRFIELADLHHSRSQLLQIVHSFVGTYQMLPSPFKLPAMKPLYNAATYRALNPPLNIAQQRLDTALQHHKELADAAADPERMVYIAGDNQLTYSNITNFARLAERESYEVAFNGDGRVTHELGLLDWVPRFYVNESHGNLPTNNLVLAALDDLLSKGHAPNLSEHPLVQRTDPAGETAARAQLEAADQADEAQMRIVVKQLRARSSRSYPFIRGHRELTRLDGQPSSDPAQQKAAEVLPPYISFDERQAEEILTRQLLPSRPEAAPIVARLSQPRRVAAIEIDLVKARINDHPITSRLPNPPVLDALAVGHYIGVKPQAAERALDEAISRALHGKLTPQSNAEQHDKHLLEADLLLTQYTERGIIRGELGQPFFIDDPRPAGVEGKRVIAIAGMGVPGRCGVPELTLIVRELCWSLGRLGKCHLATVLIGAGNGNIPIREAIGAWLQGVQMTLAGSAADEHRHLTRITFVESDPRKIESIQQAILDEQRRMQNEQLMTITYHPFNKDELGAFWEEGRKLAREEWEAHYAKADHEHELPPTRVTFELDGTTYRFGAITANAAIPERRFPLDPALVKAANDELVGEHSLARQVERGRFMELLLIPPDLRPQLYTDAPLVMLLDATTARIHWEVLAQPEHGAQRHNGTVHATGQDDFLNSFLGTARGFTRQLRTTFSPPPEPPPPPGRVLRVLVIADPAEDAHLPGAEEEGVEVADVFERFNTVYGHTTLNRVEVVRLFGPREATRTNVLRELLLRQYDVLHFAGHCMYNQENPSASGWIFSNGECLSANELDRIDRIPKFVFSNACESGITPDRAEQRSVGLAPSFAEAFFARGVSNFVCTAWPVDDVAARQFAFALYTALLGLPLAGAPVDPKLFPAPIHVAMRQARRAIAKTPNGIQTWGSYQHYGNPYFRLFDPAAMYLADALPVQKSAVTDQTDREAELN